MPNPIEELTLALREFARERDWEKFHTPRSLAMSVMIEAAEIAEHFQWTADDDPIAAAKRDAVAMEIADTLLYLLRLADRLGIDAIAAASQKMKINQTRYPVAQVYGKALKHTDVSAKP